MQTIEKLFSKPLPSTRSGAFNNTFPYPTRISPEAIAVYIACVTKPGDTVLDAFAVVAVLELLHYYVNIQLSK